MANKHMPLTEPATLNMYAVSFFEYGAKRYWTKRVISQSYAQALAWAIVMIKDKWPDEAANVDRLSVELIEGNPGV